ncbi:hypothetical protein [Rubrivirga sp.]|uniref:hypothetical protein n=1 Tax=Rubrivirga sp. TaxID=1885344 RepID=UPI003C71D770
MRAALFLSLLAAPLLTTSSGASGSWSPPDPVPLDSVAAPSAALSGGVLHVAVNTFSFRYTPEFDVRSEDVWVVSRADRVWSDPVNVSQTPTESLRPTIAVGPDGDRHVVWGERTRDVGSPSAVTSLFYATDRDGTWSPAQEIVATTEPQRGLSRRSLPVSLAVTQGGAVHVVFDGRDAGSRPQVQHFRRSANGTWDDVSSLLGHAPGLAEEDGVLYVSYEPDDPASGVARLGDVVVVTSGDDGGTWSAPEVVYDASAESPGCVLPAVDTRVAVDDGVVHAVWSRDSAFPCEPGVHFVIPREVLHAARPAERPSAWSDATAALSELPTGAPNQYVSLRLAVSEGDAHVAAYAQSGSQLGAGTQVYSSRQGGSWSPAEPLLGLDLNTSDVGIAAKPGSLTAIAGGFRVGGEFDRRVYASTRRGLGTGGRDQPTPTAHGGVGVPWPNPAHGRFTVAVDPGGVESVLEVVDAAGRVALAVPVGGRTEVEVDASGLAAGRYVVRLEGATGPSGRAVTIIR